MKYKIGDPVDFLVWRNDAEAHAAYNPMFIKRIYDDGYILVSNGIKTFNVYPEDIDFSISYKRDIKLNELGI